MTAQDRVDIAPQFPALDTVRAIGALAVLTTHSSFQTGSYLVHGVLGDLLARLDVGVAIFFVLSGFLLSRPYFARSFESLPRPALGRYYEKRALRILPVYVFAVVVALMFVPGNEDAGLGQWLSSIFLVDTFVGDSLPYGITHMWSLSVEASFYVVLPLLTWLIIGRTPRPRRVMATLFALCVISIVWHAGVSDSLDPRVAGSPNLWLPAYLSWFAAGIGLAFLHVRSQAGLTSRVENVVRGLGQQPGVCWALVAGLMLVATTPLAGPTLLEAPTAAESVTKHLLYTALGTLIVLPGVFAGPGAYQRVMSSRPLRHLGHISYSVFCIHLSLLALAFEITGRNVFTGGGLQIWLVTVAMTWIGSELLYRLVEMPAMRLKGRLGRSESAASISQTPTTTATTSN